MALRESEQNDAALAAPELAPAAVGGAQASAEPPGKLVRRVDEDRWLASRFAAKDQRPRLEKLYAFVYEIARTAEVVQEPGVAAIRLAWWRDAVATLYAGAHTATHPAAIALEEAVRAAGLPLDVIHRLIIARAKDFEERPFESWAEMEAYVDDTSGAVIELAGLVCLNGAERPRQMSAFAQAAGRAWGLTGLLRAMPIWNARKRTFFPERLLEHLKLTPAKVFAGGGDHAVQSAVRAVAERALHAHLQVRDLSRAMPPALFPAYGYVALEPAYRAAVLQSFSEPEAARMPLLQRQIKILAASALGRI